MYCFIRLFLLGFPLVGLRVPVRSGWLGPGVDWAGRRRYRTPFLGTGKAKLRPGVWWHWLRGGERTGSLGRAESVRQTARLGAPSPSWQAGRARRGKAV